MDMDCLSGTDKLDRKNDKDSKLSFFLNFKIIHPSSNDSHSPPDAH